MKPLPYLRNIALPALAAAMLMGGSARASIAYGSINNFDTVNDTGHVCHGFEIEIEDCHSTDIGYTYDYNHYGACQITEDNSVPGHPKTLIRWASKKNPDGSWASHTAIPSGPINPTDGHQFTNPSVNFGGEHFGVGYSAPVGAIHYRWLIDDGSGNLINGGNVQVATPVFVYYPPVANFPAQVQAAIQPPEPPEVPVKEFGDPVWVKEIRTTTHNNQKVHLRDLVSDDPEDVDDKNWKNGEPDEVEVEWQLLQTEFSQVDGGLNGKLDGAPEDLDNGDEVVTRRYEFFEYTGPIDAETGEALIDNVGPDDIHGDGIVTIDGVDVDASTVEVVGEYKGAQMAAVDAEGHMDLIDHVSEGEENKAYAPRSLVIQGPYASICTLDGALPAGMQFDQVDGKISGTPTESGEFQFKVTATDFMNPDVEKNYTLRIAAFGAALPPACLLDTAASPAGYGTTTGDGAFDPGQVTTVEALAEPGFRFVNWTDNGQVVSTNSSYSLTLDVNHSLVANFVVDIPQWMIATSTSPANGGTVSGDGLIDDGASATLTATPNAGFSFTNWTENGVVVSSAATYTFTATADRALSANFTALPTYQLTLASNPALGGLATGGGSHLSGSGVTVIATAAPGYVFSRWTKSNGSTASQLPSYTFNLTSNTTLTANFVVIGEQKTITLSSNPGVGGGASGAGVYASGDSATVTATPNLGYEFARWTENGTTVSTSPDYTFTVTGDRTLVARFNEAFIITADWTPADAGSTEMDSLTYKTGENAKASAIPADGWSFLNWTENGVVVSTDPDYQFSVTGNRSIRANFVSDSGPTIITDSIPAEGGTVTGDGIYQSGDPVTVSAIPNQGYAFTGWKENGVLVSSDADFSFNAAGSRVLTASFLAVPEVTLAPSVPGSNTLRLAWPANAAGWSLEESADLIHWTPSTRVPTTNGDNKEVSITPVEPKRYFRLAHP